MTSPGYLLFLGYMETYGTEYKNEDWPHGLRCIDCDKLMQEGDRYATRLIGMSEYAFEPAVVSEVICLECALTAA